MKIKQSSADHLLIVGDSPWVGAFCFVIAAISLGHFLFDVLGITRLEPDETPVTALGAFLLFLVSGAVFAKRSIFDFDLVRQQVAWRRRGLLRAKGGSIPFDKIDCAVVESITSDGGLSFRVALRTTEGSVPLTESYSFEEEKACETIRTAINVALRAETAGEAENDILQLATDGRKKDAISLVQRRYGYDLAKSRQFVEDLTAPH